VLIVSVCGGEAARAEAGSRWALLVGVDDYVEIQKLKYCGADMRTLRDLLVSAGFPEEQVFLLHDEADQTRYRPMKSNIQRQLALVLRLAERRDLVVVGFSGHGVHYAGKSYLCPSEARLGDPSTMVPLDWLYQELKKCRADLKLLLIDACRNDPRVGGQRSLSPAPETRQFATSTLEERPRGILLLASCAPGQISMEEEEFGHGVFMHFVLEGLRGKADLNRNGRVSLLELYGYTNRHTKIHVAHKYNDLQTPTLKVDELEEDFEFGVASLPIAVAPFDAAQAAIYQQRSAGQLGVPVEVTNSIDMKLVLIPAGEFVMGSPPSEGDASDNERPQHVVKITQPFYLGAHEVTQRDYQLVTGRKPSFFSASGHGKEKVAGMDTSRFPVEGVSWEDAEEFCRRLSVKEGRTYRLPTEAEWEYACRAGTTTPFHFGSMLNGRQANCDGASPYGTNQKGPSLSRTSRVGSYPANAWGLYDMHGNVWEWCSDWYSADYYARSPTSDPRGAAGASYRVNRGGSWGDHASYCRSACRFWYSPSLRGTDLGFRVANDL
jgi:formylglycine-generating enzyme required for sulfatase activity